MYNALIVDDEKSILENIQKAIPWEELGIETVFTAQNGSDALSLLEAYHIDLLISDIRMPGMDGLTLLKHVRAVYAQLVCQLRGHLISYEYCQGLLCLFSVFYFFCTGKRVPRPVHQTSWRIQDCFSSVVRSLFLVFAWPSLAANRPIPHCSLRFLSFCNIPYHTC